MTYEEQLLWFSNYLEKTIIPAFNSLLEAFQGLTYTDLPDKPSINGNVLDGDKSTAELGLEQIQFGELPEATAENLGQIIQYIGETNESLTKGYFYACISTGDEEVPYAWTNIPVQSAGSGTTDYRDLNNKPTINGVTLDGNKTTSELGIEQIQVTTMPTASQDYDGKVVQFIGSTSDPDYTYGWFYVCGYDIEASEWKWRAISVTPDNLIFYPELVNLPKINNVTLTGNKTLSDLGIETIQYSTMPTASADYVGKIVQYVGLTGGGYREGCFYRCIGDQTTTPATYYWEIVNTGETIQFAIIPPARAENEGQIIQYTGATDSNYTNGYFYKCTSDGATVPTYDWVNINVQNGGSEPIMVDYSDSDATKIAKL